jgi:hypothetical protein
VALDGQFPPRALAPQAKEAEVIQVVEDLYRECRKDGREVPQELGDRVSPAQVWGHRLAPPPGVGTALLCVSLTLPPLSPSPSAPSPHTAVQRCAAGKPPRSDGAGRPR